MANVLEEVKNVVDTLLGHAQQLKDVVDQAATAPNAEQAFVDAVVVALEAMGYTVTPPVKTTKVQVQDGDAAAEGSEAAGADAAEGEQDAPNA